MRLPCRDREQVIAGRTWSGKDLWVPQNHVSTGRLDEVPTSDGVVIPDADRLSVYVDRDPPIVVNRCQGPAAALRRITFPGQLRLDEVDLVARLA